MEDMNFAMIDKNGAIINEISFIEIFRRFQRTLYRPIIFIFKKYFFVQKSCSF